MFLIYGGREGWIAGLVGELLKQQGAKFEYGEARIEDRAAILKDIEKVGDGGGGGARAGYYKPTLRLFSPGPPAPAARLLLILCLLPLFAPLQVKPTHVINAAGVTGRPNVDWCETNKIETIRSNVIGCLTLADVCLQQGLHMTYFGTGEELRGK